MLKAKILIVIIFLSFHFISFGQDFKGGMTIGGVASQIAGDGLSGFDKAGLTGGFFVNYNLKGTTYLQMELNYVQKGSARTENPEIASEGQYLLRLGYIELPLVYQYQLEQLIFEAGISVDFLISDYEEINYSQNEQGDVWRAATFNSVFGVKYIINQHWIGSIRTVNSINSMRKNTVPLNVRRYGTGYGAFNDVLSLSLSYQF